jgi:hypothetical protein
MASSFGAAGFDSAAHARLLVDTVVALPGNAVNMMFGVQLGGKVARPDEDTGVSGAFRGAALMQENDSDWNLARADASQIEWARSVGDAVAALGGFGGAYMNEPDPGKGRGEYEELFWGRDVFERLQGVKSEWDKDSLFDCDQCVYAN